MTENEWYQHEASRQQAGLTKRGYCRQIGIKLHKYQYYRKKYAASPLSASNLAEVVVEEPISINDFSITIELSEQGTIKFSGHAKSLSAFQNKLLSLSHEKGE